jgi:hypothetical protein
MRAWVLVAVLGAACGKHDGSPVAKESGSAASSEGPAAGAGAATAAAAGAPGPAAGAGGGSPASIDDKALDAAIAAKGFKPGAVRQRKVGGHSAWAVVEAPRNADHKVVEFDLLRLRADGVAVLPLTPTARKHPTWWDSDVDPIDVRDLDGDGNDECLVVLKWLQDIPKTGTGEAAQQLYVIGGRAAPKVAFTAIIDYATESQQLTDHDKAEPPPPEHIAYDWKIGGKPPVLSLKRTENQINKKRAAGLTNPATDPLLSAGASKDIPLTLD